MPQGCMKPVKHVAFFKFKPGGADEDIADGSRIIGDLPGQIHGIRDLT